MKLYFGTVKRTDNLIPFIAKKEIKIILGKDVLVKMHDGIWSVRVVDYAFDFEYRESFPVFHEHIRDEEKKIIEQNFSIEQEYREKIDDFLKEKEKELNISELETNFNRTKLIVYYKRYSKCTMNEAETEELEDILKTRVEFIEEMFSELYLNHRFNKEFIIAFSKQLFTKGTDVIVLKDDGIWPGRILGQMSKKNNGDHEDIRALGIIDDNIRMVQDVLMKKETEAFDLCKKYAKEDKLNMNLLRAEYSLNSKKVYFYYTSEGRIDFRNLVKTLATNLKKRIEMKQIGVRDEFKTFPTVAICGQQTCCSRFIQNFSTIVLKMAKMQNMDINTEKITGVCNRLLCCLKYEYGLYNDFLIRVNQLPKRFKYTEEDGVEEVYTVIGFNPTKETVLVRKADYQQKSVPYEILSRNIKKENVLDGSRPLDIPEERGDLDDPDVTQ